MKFILTTVMLFCLTFFLSGCNNVNDTVNNNENNLAVTQKYETKKPVESDISSFSTPLTSGSPNRVTNIKLTCNKINGLTLKNGETFSFNQIVGPCTAEEGYLESEIYVNQKIEYALGGGNCQVSTTLYNACLQVPGIAIVERNEHKRKKCRLYRRRKRCHCFL